jgi:hypothetical protein
MAPMANAVLQLACNEDVPVGADMEFRASRLSAPVADRWTLCVSTDGPAIRLRHVSPPPHGYVMDRDGVLGLTFPSTVDTVRLFITALDVGVSEWQVWVDDGPIGPEDEDRAI